MLIANNCTRQNGQFMGDQLCYLKAAYLMVSNQPDVDRVVMGMSSNNEMHFLWTKFIEKYNVEVVYDNLNPGDNPARWAMWDNWRTSRMIDGRPFDHYRELYLRIHGAPRQAALCGHERGLMGSNIYEYLYYGQEHKPETPPVDVEEWDNHGVKTRYSYGDDLIHHPARAHERDVYISPHAKTQGNTIFTFDFWDRVVRRLVDDGVSITVGYDHPFCDDLRLHPLYVRHWGTHEEWMVQVCRHKLVACGNTGTGWLAAACGVPMITMEPPHSQMPDHRYRECGLRNLVEVVAEPNAEYVADQIRDYVKRRVVMTTGCYDVLHAGHVRHLQLSRAMGTKLIVALNSDYSVRALKGSERPINPEAQRRAVLEALRCVDEVVTFNEPDPRDLILKVRPDVLTAGFGYTEDKIVGRDDVKGWGGTVCVTCPTDASTWNTSTTKVTRRLRAANIAEIIRDAAPYSVNPPDKLMLMARHFLTVAHLSGDVTDLGTCKGGTGLILRRLAPDKHLHLFDTWAGTPYDDPLCHHKRGEWAAALDECRKLVGGGDMLHFHQGVFPVWDGDDRHDDHYRPAGENLFCFVYVDMDTEQATHDALTFFWPRMATGGKIVIDDYGWEPCAGVKKAVDEQFPDEECRLHMPAYCTKTVVRELYTCILEKR